MCPETRSPTKLHGGLRSQRGIGLPAAIFVITVMTAIAVAINLMVSQNTTSFEEDIRLTRAFYAAESGAGLGVRALFPASDYPHTAVGSCPASSTYEFSVPGLMGCRAEVRCDLDATVDEVDYHLITSVGICGDTTRTVEVTTRFVPGP